MAATFDIAGARTRFPALNQEQVFMDNAGKFADTILSLYVFVYISLTHISRRKPSIGHGD